MTTADARAYLDRLVTLSEMRVRRLRTGFARGSDGDVGVEWRRGDRRLMVVFPVAGAFAYSKFVAGRKVAAETGAVDATRPGGRGRDVLMIRDLFGWLRDGDTP